MRPDTLEGRHDFVRIGAVVTPIVFNKCSKVGGKGIYYITNV